MTKKAVRKTSVVYGAAFTAGFFALPFAASATLASAPPPCDNAGTATPFITLTQLITQPDAGNDGNWANDTLTENVSAWVGMDGTTFCASGTISGGTFVTTGPDSPENGFPLDAGITGTFTGGETWVFPVGSVTTTAASLLTLPPDDSTTSPQFSAWQSQVFNNQGTPGTYSFTYVVDGYPNNTWTNADPASGGVTGDITDLPPTTVYVDASTGNDSNTGSQADPFETIQAAINAVAASGTVDVDPGTYQEQVIIDKSLTLAGAGASNTTIEAPAVINNDRNGNEDVVDITSSAGPTTVAISGFTITGLNLSPCNGNGYGVYVGGGATAEVRNNIISDIADNPLSGCRFGAGIAAGNLNAVTGTNSDTGTLMADSNVISGYQKTGIVVEDAGSMGTITNNTITGVGTTTALTQNGVAIIFGATGTVSGNTISGNNCTLTGASGQDTCTGDYTSDPNADGAAGIQLYAPGTSVTIENNTLTGNQFGIWSVAAPAVTITNNTVTGENDGPGISVWDTDQLAAIVPFSPAETTGTISGNTVSGNDYGILLRNYSGGEGPDVTLSGSNILTGNTVNGIYSDVNADATGNYWGSEAGPGSDGVGGTGTVSTSPWLCYANDTVTTTTGNDCPNLTPSTNGPVASAAAGGGGGSTPTALPNNGSSAPSATSTTGTTGSTTGSTAPAGQVLGAAAYDFATNFGIGTTGEDVTQLQTVLIADDYLNISAPTGYFGSLTQASVEKYQAANGISPTSGYVGLLTRTSLNKGVTPTSGDELRSLEQELASLEAEIASLESTSTTAQ